jgi:hypothetical protein
VQAAKLKKSLLVVERGRRVGGVTECGLAPLPASVPTHQAIAWLRSAGRKADARDWNYGETIVIPYGGA